MKKILPYIIAAVLCALCYYFGFKRGNNIEPKIEIQRDTIITHTTDTIIQPKFITERIIIYDTIYIKDTTILLPVSQKYYSNINYEAWVSGYKPNLDSLKINNTTTYINTTTTKIIEPKNAIAFNVGEYITKWNVVSTYDVSYIFKNGWSVGAGVATANSQVYVGVKLGYVINL